MGRRDRLEHLSTLRVASEQGFNLRARADQIRRRCCQKNTKSAVRFFVALLLYTARVAR